MSFETSDTGQILLGSEYEEASPEILEINQELERVIWDGLD